MTLLYSKFLKRNAKQHQATQKKKKKKKTVIIPQNGEFKVKILNNSRKKDDQQR